MTEREKMLAGAVYDCGDPELLAYWNQIPPRARLRLLDSTITVSTLGELKKLAEELGQDTTVHPE